MIDLSSWLLPLSVALAPAAADPDRFIDGGVTYILYADTYRQVDDEIRQIGFSLKMTEAEGAPGNAVAMNGVVQVNCGTRSARMIGPQLFDDQNRPVATDASGPDHSSPWEELGTMASDQHLYRRVCEREKSAP